VCGAIDSVAFAFAIDVRRTRVGRSSIERIRIIIEASAASTSCFSPLLATVLARFGASSPGSVNERIVDSSRHFRELDPCARLPKGIRKQAAGSSRLRQERHKGTSITIACVCLSRFYLSRGKSLGYPGKNLPAASSLLIAVAASPRISFYDSFHRTQKRLAPIARASAVQRPRELLSWKKIRANPREESDSRISRHSRIRECFGSAS